MSGLFGRVAIGGHGDRDRMVQPFQWMLGML